jgi:hypothetical protein
MDHSSFGSRVVVTTTIGSFIKITSDYWQRSFSVAKILQHCNIPNMGEGGGME